MYATIKASGKKIRLKTKYQKKLWPLRAATRAGQKARATQIQTNAIAKTVHPKVESAITSNMTRLLSVDASDSHFHWEWTSPRWDETAHVASSARRQPVKIACTAAAPTIGSVGAARLGGWKMNGLVCGPPSPPWKQISSSKAQP